MDISIDGWGDVIIALVAVTLLILIGFIAAVWVYKHRNKVQDGLLSAESAGLNGDRRELDQRKLDLDTRERELNEREMKHDDLWRDQLNMSAVLDRREAEIEARERQNVARKPGSVRGW